MKTKSTLYAILLSICTLAFTVNGYSQEQETSDEVGLTPKFGIKGGVNFSNLYINNVTNEQVKLSGQIGLYAKLPITRGVSIQPELLYTSKGAKTKYDNIAQGSGEYRFNLNYIELPLLLVFNVVKNFNIHLGGYAAYLTSANVKNLNDGTIKGFTDLNADNFNRVDYGLAGGVGVDIHKFTIGARYNYGLREVGQSGNLSGELTKNSKNSTASLYIGFAF